MPPIGPIKRRDLMAYLRQLGFSGPYSGTKHQFLMKGPLRIRLPNPHGGDISRGLLARILQEAAIDKDDWERL